MNIRKRMLIQGFTYLLFIFCIAAYSSAIGMAIRHRTVLDPGHTNLYVNSIPKCGTHLLTKCVCLLTRRPLYEIDGKLTFKKWENILKRHKYQREFFATHVAYSPQAALTFKKNNYKHFLICRDPRDKVVSHVYWIYKGGWKQAQLDNPLRKLPFKKVLEHVIRHVKRQYDKFLPWMRDPSCLSVRFENLIGPQGGGSRQAQMNEIRKVARHGGIKLNPKLINYCADRLFGGSPTFREGKIGSWKKHFDKHDKALFKQATGSLLRDLGYETDDNW